MKISYYILISFGVILLMFSITTYYNIHLSKAVTENSAYLSRSTNIIRSSGRFQRNILTMVNGLRGYLLTGQRTFIEAYDSANIENDVILLELSELLSDSTQSRLLREIKTLNDEWTQEYTEPIRDAKMMSQVSDSNLAAYNLIYKDKISSGRESRIQNELQQKFREFSVYEYELRDDNRTRLSERVTLTTRLSILFMILSVLFAVAIVWLMIYKISGRIRQMTNMANTIAAGNYSIKISESVKDELSPLGHSLNLMSQELSKNISLLKRSNEELEQFAHIVSHDMKGPLRGIGNVIAWIDEDHKTELTPTLAKYLGLMKERVKKAEALIEGLLSYARADNEEMSREKVSLNALIQEVLENLPEHQNIRTEVADLPELYTEKLLLFQVFSNLISNAFRYIDKEKGLVKIYYKEHADTYEFFVEDNGIGIASQHHQRIFVIFQTLQDKNLAENSTGVGLAIVKKIVTGRNQQINLYSEPGKGSVFSFTWPKN
jgi:signal transduction histidine kinase